MIILYRLPIIGSLIVHLIDVWSLWRLFDTRIKPVHTIFNLSSPLENLRRSRSVLNMLLSWTSL